MLIRMMICYCTAKIARKYCEFATVVELNIICWYYFDLARSTSLLRHTQKSICCALTLGEL